MQKTHLASRERNALVLRYVICTKEEVVDVSHSTQAVLEVAGECIRVTRRRNQRRMYIRVKAPDGRIEVSAPWRVGDAEVKRFVSAHIGWIEQQRLQLAERERPNPGAPTPEEIAEWRAVVAAFTPVLVERWVPIMGVKPGKLAYRNMVSRWGSCNVKTGRICINVQLAAHSPECLEYVVVHELCHLLEASHGPRFKALMDTFLPDWRQREAKLRGGIRR